MNVLLISPYLEQKKGPFVWAKNFARNFSNSYEGLYLLTFDENQPSMKSSSSFVHVGFNIEKKVIKYPYISLIPKIVYLEKKYNINVVQTNDTLVSFCALLARKFTKVPVVLRVGGEYFNEICQWSEEQSKGFKIYNTFANKAIVLILKTVGNYSMKRVDQLIAVNKYMQEYFQRYGFESQVICNAVDPCDFILEESNVNNDSILAISNMDIPKKVEGVKLLIDAIRLLKNDLPDIRLKIAGDGLHFSYLKNYVDELSLNENVTFLGYVNNVSTLLRNCGIYVHSSMQDVFPNSILEAMASRKPVVAVNIGGISEIIIDGYNGILCEPNVGDLAKSIFELRGNEALKKEVATNGHLTVTNEFSWNSVIDKYVQNYQKILRS